MPSSMQPLFDTTSDKPAVLSVTSLNRLARSLLETNFPNVLVEGEISNLAMPASGHWYLTLKDKTSQLRCAMFRGNNRQVHFRPENGQQVLVRGRLSIYEGRGDYQLIAESMEQAGDGALRRAFEELKAKLQAEGLFDAQHKQSVRDNYRHIGIITSATGAAIRDLLSVFGRRFPATHLTLIPVTVQGRDAAPEIVKALENANRLSGKLGLEALIVGRGGGSLEDLQAFNEEAVARAIFASKLPVTSAVGHEIDFTISDFVADQRAPTPSAAAELMSPSRTDYLQQCQAYSQTFTQLARQHLRVCSQQLDNLQRHLKRPDRRLQDHAQTLDRLDAQLRRVARNKLKITGTELYRLQRSLVLHSPLQTLRRLSDRIIQGRQALRQSVQSVLEQRKAGLAELSRGLSGVSPLNTLARGYSITYDETGQVLRKATDARLGNQITTRLAEGSLRATVDEHLADEKDQ